MKQSGGWRRYSASAAAAAADDDGHDAHYDGDADHNESAPVTGVPGIFVFLQYYYRKIGFVKAYEFRWMPETEWISRTYRGSKTIRNTDDDDDDDFSGLAS